MTLYPDGAAPGSACPPGLDAWAAAGPFEGTLREIVHAFKYDGRWSLARPLATLMRQAGGPLLEACDIVVPVPLHPSRRRARGFDQAEALARGLGRPVVAALARHVRTRPQASLPLEARRRNVSGAFGLAGRELTVGWRSYRAGVAVARLRGVSMVLVDDVATSGSTLEACAAVLRGAGAARVTALTVARALPPRPR
ncbi:MAG: ComF family protein [Vicinamibacteraceae bacterium]|nr:ComF family protein [Vicinamibacteraceae bacterium]